MYAEASTFDSTMRKRWSFWEYLLCLDAMVQINGYLHVIAFYLISVLNLGGFTDNSTYPCARNSEHALHYEITEVFLVGGIYAGLFFFLLFPSYLIFRFKHIKIAVIIIAALATAITLFSLTTRSFQWFNHIGSCYDGIV